MERILKIKIFFLLLNSYYMFIQCNPTPDVTFIGSALYSDGICRIPIGLIDSLKNTLDINFIVSGFYNPENISEDVKKIIEAKDNRIGKVSFLFDSPWHRWGEPHKSVPESHIKIAYSMLESSRIPQQWVDIFNQKFDAVVVPDDFLIHVYQQSGVRIPIFVVPIGLYLEDFLALPVKKDKNKIFTFGSSGVLIDNKNQSLLIEAFHKTFNNSPHVKLVLHARGGNNLEKIKRQITRLGAKNIKVIFKSLQPVEYLQFMKSLDCYVLLSKGEGFSITPREALARGLPCILSNNSAHMTIIKSNTVAAVESNIPEDAYYEPFGFSCGHRFNCNVTDVQKALLDVYANYDLYLNRAHVGREWVQQYLYSSVKAKYQTLIKPAKVTYGSENKVLDNEIITNSIGLYEKYNDLVVK